MNFSNRKDKIKMFFLLFMVCVICVFMYMFTQNENETFEDMFEQSNDIMLIPKEREEFIERVISDFDNMYTSWVSIDVDSPTYKGKALIENFNLYYHYFRQFRSADRKKREEELDELFKENREKYYKEGFDKEEDLIYEKDEEEYKRIMFSVLRNKSILKIKKEEDFNEYYFHKVPNNETIVADAQKGVDHFIKTYIQQEEGDFKGMAFNRELTEEEQYAIINQLYDFNIAVRRNCDDGNFFIYYLGLD